MMQLSELEINSTIGLIGLSLHFSI